MQQLKIWRRLTLFDLKACPKCNKLPDMDTVNYGRVWGCLIGCSNIACDGVEVPVIKFALSKKRAKKKAVKAWNRRRKDNEKAV